VESYLAASTIFVLPSVREAMPISLLEAMAAGRPCIASRVGGVPEVLRDGTNGLIVPPADAPALANAILRLLPDGDLRDSLGLQATRDVSTPYDKKNLARRWADIYRSIA
jgi:glycosyltransferase involved in cell wall biosynthesis